MEIKQLTDASFGKYGRVLTEFPFEKILKEMEHTRFRRMLSMWPQWKSWKLCPRLRQ